MLQSDWERTRTQTFILFNNSRTRKTAVHWGAFKKDIFPLATDTQYNGKVVTQKRIDGTMTVDQFQDWLKGKKPVDLEIIKEG